ncbi:hypothetical protein ACLOJK_011940 [Asimina triloba]
MPREIGLKPPTPKSYSFSTVARTSSNSTMLDEELLLHLLLRHYNLDPGGVKIAPHFLLSVELATEFLQLCFGHLQILTDTDVLYPWLLSHDLRLGPNLLPPPLDRRRMLSSYLKLLMNSQEFHLCLLQLVLEGLDLARCPSCLSSFSLRLTTGHYFRKGEHACTAILRFGSPPQHTFLLAYHVVFSSE